MKTIRFADSPANSLALGRSRAPMTRMLSVIAPGKICKARPQLVRNAPFRNNIDVAQCVKQIACGTRSPDLA
ncbi:hypothetical protein BJS_01741 [Bradyrhizobium japonicum SEMIA 5079]|nr:hypothetical protein BJS_01741 [Bradyrhizobium japonicum SEMIA 5079]